MSEFGPGPGPEESGENPEDEELDEFEKLEKLKEELLAEGIDPEALDLEVGVRLGDIEEPMPRPPMREFLPDETHTLPNGEEHTVNGILVEKVLARETFLVDQAIKLDMVRLGDMPLTAGMIGVIGQGEASELVKVVSVTYIKDEKFDKGSRHTMPKVTVITESGETRDEVPKALYLDPKRPNIPESLRSEVEIEYEGVEWRIGEYFALKSERSYIGRVAMIPNQNENPGQLVVMLRDRYGKSELFLIEARDITKPQ